MDKYEVGLVLGGGGARGFAHLGVLKALAEKGITPDIISGVSAGAIAGVFLAAGKQPEEAMELMKENRFTDYAGANLPRSGFLNLENLKENLAEHLEAHTFSELRLPFYAAAADLYSGEIHYLQEGPLIPIIQASASIPVLFSPVEINNCLYVDGGLLNNLPIKPLLGKCEKIIVINVMPIDFTRELDNLIEVAARTFQLSVSGNNESVRNQCDLFIEPDKLKEYHILETSKAAEIFTIGYNYCHNLVVDL